MTSKDQHRTAGVLLHPTSLPGRFGVGDLGPELARFLEWVAAAGQSIWQVLPLGPPDFHNAPYGCLSAFAGNPLLISPELLVAEELLPEEELQEAPGNPDWVDFGAVKPWKERLLRQACQRFLERSNAENELTTFTNAPEQRAWLDDWVLFEALRNRHEDGGWWDWPAEIRDRDPAALNAARGELASEIRYQTFVQWVFFRQWDAVRKKAAEHGLQILGDIPIYVSWNSAEVWSRPDLFDLDANGYPLSVAGVPPDYFSETGQLWGNPIFRWDRMAEEGYAWWVERLRANLRLADVVRLDHFRAFASYWRVPAGEETAINGEWVPGPRTAFFDAVGEALGHSLDDLPLLAEDLGEVTPDVGELLEAVGLPCMRVLQFGFDNPDSIHAPHNLPRHSIAYTGTHDNNTTAGWYAGLEHDARCVVNDYCGVSEDASPETFVHAMVRTLYASVAQRVVIPVQDVLALPTTARMNLPGDSEGNWQWRLPPGRLTHEHAGALRHLAWLTGRWKEPE